MDDSDGIKGEKGQKVLRYNDNGIIIDDAAFEKLQSEVNFRKLKAKSGVVEEDFYVGQYPDVAGKMRDIWFAKVGWVVGTARPWSLALEQASSSMRCCRIPSLPAG